jgi:transketolase
MRRKKDSELCKGELDKIVEKQSELEKGHFVKEELLHRAKKIEDKVKKMQKFEAFLEKVKEQHPDEFQELNDILARYKTLSDSNIKLQA